MNGKRKPLDIVREAAENPGHDLFVTTGTLQLLDADGVPVEYITGEMLTSALQRAYKLVYGPVNEERRRRLAAIDDWVLGPGLFPRLADAIVGPLMDGLRAPGARLLHLCTVALRRDLAAMNNALWWTPSAIAPVERANPATRENGLAWRTFSMVNYMCYHYVSGQVVNTNLPFDDSERGRELHAIHAGVLGRLIRGILSALAG